MSRSPYAPPLPYGGWALSFTILLGGFVWARREDAAAAAAAISTGNEDTNTAEGDSSSASSASCNRGAETSEDQAEEEEEREGAHEGRNFRTPSSAYQTDREVGAKAVRPSSRQHLYILVEDALLAGMTPVQCVIAALDPFFFV